MRLEEAAKIRGSARLDVKWSRIFVVVLAEGERIVRRRDQISPTNTSRARVAAKRVRSRVRPACGLGLCSDLGDPRGVAAVVSVVVDGMLCLDWSNRRLSHAAMNEDSHLDSLGVSCFSMDGRDWHNLAYADMFSLSAHLVLVVSATPLKMRAIARRSTGCQVHG